MKKRRSFLLRLSVPDTDGEAYRLLKQALKRMLRTMGIKCDEVQEGCGCSPTEKN